MQQTYEQLKKVDPQSAQQYLDAAKAADAEIQARARSGGQDRSAYADVVRRGVEGEGQGIANYQAKLDALSPEERRAPVAVITHHGTWSYRDDELADINDPESSPLVQLNPTFFDRTRPATAPQIVTVCIPGIQGLENKAYERLAEGSERDQERRSLEQQTRDAVRIRDHLDWAALEAMVKQ